MEINKVIFSNLIKEFKITITFGIPHMDLKSYFIRIKKRFLELWNDYKIFRYALILHLGYFIVSLVLILTIFREQNDFLIFYNAGGIFLKDVNDLYNQEHYIWDYRYLPLSAVIFIPFYIVGYDLGVILYQFLTLFLNILSSILIYKICIIVKGEGHEEGDKRVVLFSSLYLMGIPHCLNYILGQINVYITFYILLSLYIFLTKEGIIWEFIGSVFIGISIIIKPTALFLIPFILVIQIKPKEKKIDLDLFKSLVRVIGVLSPVMLNGILFFLYPKMFKGFIETNFTGSNPLTINFSFSLTKLILNFCYLCNIPFNQIYILLTMVIIVGGIGFLFFMVMENDKYKIIYGYTFGFIIMLLVYYDSWDHHLLNLTPLLIIIIFNLPRKSELINNYFKRPFFFFNFFDLAYMGLWFLTVPYFPFNFMATIFLILSFIGLCKYCLLQKSERRKIE
ncbi:MAG: glycosyltransferase family 87 protein [Promethearchaeota archaeon]